MSETEPWVKITKSGQSFVYMTGFGTESNGSVQVSDTGVEANFEDVAKKAKEFLERKTWRNKK